MGRLLITLFLMERGRLSQPLLYLSDYIDAHRNDYYELLQRVRTHGDWPGWLRYFVQGVYETATDAVSRSTRLLELRERYLGRLEKLPRTRQLVDALFTNPYITAAHAARSLDVSQPTARAELQRLEKLGLVREITGRRWGRLYLAEEILKAVEDRGGGAMDPGAAGRSVSG